MEMDAEPANAPVKKTTKTADTEAPDAWYKSLLPKHSKMLEILHFNDVYNIEGKKLKEEDKDKPVVLGGAARFRSALDQYRSKDRLVVFSGDLFFPSLRKWNFLIDILIVSSRFEGEQMIKPFETMNVDVNCLGNHELDFGYDKAIELMNKTTSPWLMTNLIV